ncbi:hypothetical protein [Marinobacterium rhizophilum]|uniref:Type II secretion system protein n=1 Tax=Marinobacterium rhizophilum TaxID=420402 RepID=A0ABY5HI52_9GAMM|nr:hypothetical protein [Marinobacterium rhizophilum]UTW12043.1 hypothetical protein KDW95_22940 [Marinobacterium rhizophilum]
MKSEIKKNAQTKKQGGFVMTTELVLLVTVMVMGMVIGLVTMRDAVTAEMEDVAEAIGALDQSYAFQGIVNAENTAAVDGSIFVDAVDSVAGDTEVFEFVTQDFVEGRAALGAASPGAASADAAGTVTP